MHIPDGYLGPQTYVPAYGVMIPLWWRASAVLKRTLRNRRMPMLALGAAFSFVIMMFNIPIVGGTSGHAVGGVLVAILLGPWAAMVAVTLALAVQALMFGDGGITAFGANCLSMAVTMPFAGWTVYRLIAGGSARKQVLGAAVGGYVGLNAAALVTAVMFGIQPMIAHDAMGRGLYCPFGLKIALTAMCGSHLLFLGFVEAALTGLVVAYLQRVEPGLLGIGESGKPRRLPAIARVGIIIGALTVLSPLGLYLPARFGGGTAWGEWSSGEIAKLTGHMPAGLRHLESTWTAPAPDYTIPGRESASLATQSVIYIVAAIAGAAAIVLLAFVLWQLLWRKDNEVDPGVDAPANEG